jgi:hypothetical protein
MAGKEDIQPKYTPEQIRKFERERKKVTDSFVKRGLGGYGGIHAEGAHIYVEGKRFEVGETAINIAKAEMEKDARQNLVDYLTGAALDSPRFRAYEDYTDLQVMYALFGERERSTINAHGVDPILERIDRHKKDEAYASEYDQIIHRTNDYQNKRKVVEIEYGMRWPIYPTDEKYQKWYARDLVDIKGDVTAAKKQKPRKTRQK